MKIKSTAELSVEDIEKMISDGYYGEIEIDDPNSSYNAINRYPLSKFLEIKKEIVNFLKDMPKFDESEPDREKKIFTYIYTKMSYLITYDYLAADATNDRHHPQAEILVDKASNLEGAMLHKKTICSGYSETLRNLLAECGIESIVVSGGAKTYADRTPDYEGSHAWNQVFLDGTWYHCDITNDADFIKEGLEAIHFLKSDADCTRLKKYPPKEPEKFKTCPESISSEKQFELISEARPKILEELAPKEKPETKKPGFFESILKKLHLIKSSQKGAE